ncbi:MAG TPA: hypothetical protein VM165_14205 [Planctomycetaceae bacterium]|nr:hypothetical protein [Planctomycetaceae bacterium]
MKKSTPPVETDTGPAAEIATMSKLTQQSAAWLIGCSPRTLRDHPEIARHPDGTYSGKVLVEWLRNQGSAPELSDDDYEIALRLADEFDEGSASRMVKAMEQLVKAIGGDPALALAAVWQVISDDVRERAGLYPAIYPFVTGFTGKIYVCEDCGRYRNGRKWHPGPHPDKPNREERLMAVCPKCSRGYRHREDDDE